MPVPTSNQGAESKRWLVPLLATCATDPAGGAHLREWSLREPCSSAQGGAGARWLPANADRPCGRAATARRPPRPTAPSVTEQPCCPPWNRCSYRTKAAARWSAREKEGLGWTKTAQVGLRRRWGFEAVLSSLPTAAVAMVTASCRWTSPARASADRTLAPYSGHGLPTVILRPFLGGRVDRSQRTERSARGRTARSRPGRPGNGGTRG